MLEDKGFTGLFTEYAVQGAQSSTSHAEFVKSKGGKIVWLSQATGEALVGLAELHPAPGVSALDHVAATFQAYLNASPGHIFVSFDIDSIRAADCPGVSCPGTVGLTSDMALRICYLAGRHPRVKLMDVSEMNPAVEGYLTPRLVTQMLYVTVSGCLCVCMLS